MRIHLKSIIFFFNEFLYLKENIGKGTFAKIDLYYEAIDGVKTNRRFAKKTFFQSLPVDKEAYNKEVILIRKIWEN